MAHTTGGREKEMPAHPHPAHPHINRYYADLAELKEIGGSDNELNIRPAFQNCLAAYCAAHREKLVLVPELASSRGNRPDGTVRDALRMARGYWEAKDPHGNLDEEIEEKFSRGYPRDNPLFEDSSVAMLFRKGEEAMQADLPSVIGSLQESAEVAGPGNPTYHSVAADFLAVCQVSISLAATKAGS